MAKKKKEHVVFDQMASKKNSIPFGKVNSIPSAKGNSKYAAQSAPKKMVQQRRMGAK